MKEILDTMPKKIAIFGDSFSDPTWVKNNYLAWPELLEKDFKVTNFSLSGTGLWWSYRQFKKLHHDFDYCIFSVTMPGRVHIESLDRHLNLNPTTWPVWYGTNFGEMYFQYFYSEEREQCFHDFMVEDIKNTPNTLVIPGFIESMPTHDGWSLCHFADMEMYHYGLQHPGANENRKCHLSMENNKMVYSKILDAIDQSNNVLLLSKEDYVVPADPMSRYWK
jgi:hypothetical protein